MLVRVATDNIPLVAGPDRIKARELGHGFWQIDAHFGFAQTPNVRGSYAGRRSRSSISTSTKSRSLSGAPTSNRRARPGMARWREHLYIFLTRLATRSTEFFRIPPDQVIELGAEVEI